MNKKSNLGKNIIISGAGSGIGKETAKLLAKSEFNLILLGRNEQKLAETKYQIEESQPNSTVAIYACDISSEKSIDECFLKIHKSFSKIFGLVNNAGINLAREDIVKTKVDDWKSVLETNLSGTYFLTKKTIPLMIKEKEGSIVNISSIAGILGMKNRFSYSVTKSALLGFTRSISVDYAAHKIRSNCICPGYIKTPLTEKMINSLSKKDYQALVTKHPLGLGKELYVAEAIEFLLSEKSKWITGANIPVDGGYSLGRD
ncbi:MAG: SDR family oxidoreductase [Pseudomonadota bacterium]|nr:SDR family oxidoreductase [Pseudomonadota bacterium]